MNKRILFSTVVVTVMSMVIGSCGVPATPTPIPTEAHPTMEAISGLVGVDVTDSTGRTEFQDPVSGTPVTINVVSTSGEPVSNVEVTYAHSNGSEVFFVKNIENDNLIGAGFYPYNSEHTIRAEIGLPYHLQKMTPEEAEAAQKHCDAFGYCDEVSYIGTISKIEYIEQTTRAYQVVMAELNILLIASGVKFAIVWDDLKTIDPSIADVYQWDVYEYFDNFCKCSGSNNYRSQPPAVTHLDVKVEDATVTFQWEATDPTRYPNGFIDYTIFKAGPTRFSDITFYYTVMTEDGRAISDWQATEENSATISDLAPGEYSVYVYAIDDVNNYSETRFQFFHIAQEPLLAAIMPDVGTQSLQKAMAMLAEAGITTVEQIDSGICEEWRDFPPGEWVFKQTPYPDVEVTDPRAPAIWYCEEPEVVEEPTVVLSSDYYPLSVGDYWVTSYFLLGGGWKEFKREVLGTREINGKTVFAVKDYSNLTGFQTTYRVDYLQVENGKVVWFGYDIYGEDGKLVEETRPTPSSVIILEFPLYVGQEMECSYSFTSAPKIQEESTWSGYVEIHRVVESVWPISVPAGDFEDCYQVRRTVEITAHSTTQRVYTDWFCPGVGQAQWSYEEMGWLGQLIEYHVQ